MPIFVSLLRGINVGGHKTIRMADLSALYESLGLAGPQTLLQTGNVVFAGEAEDCQLLGKRIGEGIEGRFDFRCQVMVRTADELQRIIDRNPFLMRDSFDPSKMLVMFLANAPESAAIDDLVCAHRGSEEIQVAGEDVYLSYPNDIGRSKLSNVFIEKKLGVLGSGRNWNTVTRLMALAESHEGH